MRTRRTRDDLREELLASALVEFGEKGFDGASTRSIAERADAHQPQINYHFASKEELWKAAVDHLFSLLATAMDGAGLDGAGLDGASTAATMAEMIRRLVRFAAAHPELNRIMVHEGTAATDRLTWLTETHVAPWYGLLRSTWEELRVAGIAAPIDAAMVHYVLVGAASLPYVNAPEARILTGREPTGPDWVESHADALVATFLPGLPSPSNHPMSTTRTDPT